MPGLPASNTFPKDKALAATKSAIGAKGDCELASIGVSSTTFRYGISEFEPFEADARPRRASLYFPGRRSKKAARLGAHIDCHDKPG